jgi:hypothetical protein
LDNSHADGRQRAGEVSSPDLGDLAAVSPPR